MDFTCLFNFTFGLLFEEHHLFGVELLEVAYVLLPFSLLEEACMEFLEFLDSQPQISMVAMKKGI